LPSGNLEKEATRDQPALEEVEVSLSLDIKIALARFKVTESALPHASVHNLVLFEAVANGKLLSRTVNYFRACCFRVETSNSQLKKRPDALKKMLKNGEVFSKQR
jgi:hypothetical protein